MNFNKMCPEDLIKLSASISLLLTEKFNEEELCVLKNLLCAVTNNISTYLGQCTIYNKNKNKKD